jgi:hypothetical protein
MNLPHPLNAFDMAKRQVGHDMSGNAARLSR